LEAIAVNPGLLSPDVRVKAVFDVVFTDIKDAAKRQWELAYLAGGASLFGAATAFMDTKLAELVIKSLPELVKFGKAVVDKRRGASSTTISFTGKGLHSFYFFLDEYRSQALELPRMFTDAVGSYIPNVLSMLEGKENADAGPAANTDGEPALPTAPPSKSDLRKILGVTGNGKDVMDLVVDYSIDRGRLPKQDKKEAKDRYLRDLFRAGLFECTFRRLALLAETGWTSLLEALRKSGTSGIAKGLAAGNADATAQFNGLRAYVQRYRQLWNVTNSLDALLPDVVPDNFWLGADFWSYVPTADYWAATINANGHGESTDRLGHHVQQGARSLGFDLLQKEPLLLWLIQGGKPRMENVLEAMPLPSRLEQVAPAERTPLVRLFRKVAELGAARGFPAIEGDVLGPVSGLLAAGSTVRRSDANLNYPANDHCSLVPCGRSTDVSPESGVVVRTGRPDGGRAPGNDGQRAAR
jgi:hypothetical protein